MQAKQQGAQPTKLIPCNVVGHPFGSPSLQLDPLLMFPVSAVLRMWHGAASFSTRMSWTGTHCHEAGGNPVSVIFNCIPGCCPLCGYVHCHTTLSAQLE